MRNRKCVTSRPLWFALPRETGLLEQRENMNAIAPDSMLILIHMVLTRGNASEWIIVFKVPCMLIIDL